MRTIVLDSGPLGMLAHRGGLPEIDECKAWLERLLAGGGRVIVPEICDYEVLKLFLLVNFSILKAQQMTFPSASQNPVHKYYKSLSY